MTLPDFVIGGVQKGGTTSLFHYVRRHPEVWMSPVKEIQFFNHNYHLGLDWYADHFAGHGDEPAIGEASPGYLTHPEAAARMAQVVPDVRIVFLLRDPVDRAFSAYWWRVARGAQSVGQTFSEAIRSPEGEKLYLHHGLYDRHLDRFLSHFRRDQVHVIVTEELDREPQRVLAACFEFLGVDPSFRPQLANRYNAMRLPRNRLSRLVNRGWLLLWRRTGYHLPLGVKRRVKSWIGPVRETARKMTTTRQKNPTVSEEDRAYLNRLYRPYVMRLCSILDRDLTSVWL